MTLCQATLKTVLTEIDERLNFMERCESPDLPPSDAAMELTSLRTVVQHWYDNPEVDQ